MKSNKMCLHKILKLLYCLTCWKISCIVEGSVRRQNATSTFEPILDLNIEYDLFVCWFVSKFKKHCCTQKCK